jgi:uncharacterized lipoprotein YmbA
MRSKFTRHTCGRLAVLCCCLWVSACAGNRTPSSPRVYVLEPAVSVTPVVPQSTLRVAIGPLEIAQYLDQPALVTRRGTHELELHHDDRWGMPLQRNLVDVLRTTIERLMPGANASAYPSNLPTPFDVRVGLEISRFDGVPGGTVELRASWQFYAPDGRALSGSVGHAALREQTAGDNIAALIESQSRLVTALAREIGVALDKR